MGSPFSSSRRQGEARSSRGTSFGELLVIGRLTDLLASQAEPLAAPPVDVGGGEFVSLTAMGASTITFARRMGTADVLEASDRLEVSRVDAGAIQAKMV